MKIAVVDNKDSFTYNLVHYLEQYADSVNVFRYNLINVSDLEYFDRIVISPGPGLPSDYPIIRQILDVFHDSKPILGICLGHQAIFEYFGGNLINLESPCHGLDMKTKVIDKNELLFRDVPPVFSSGRYHSWIADEKTIPDSINVTAVDDTFGYIMALSHRKFNIRGMQFHPESVMTGYGMKMIENWVKSVRL
ncbi:MAG: hypothetical protein A2W91_02875 [Bacteroidetes bacterium GWF2_38_335]|nr:MAG: hypothetical protein A2W91_02875 [Bacteroidetes bacterium GWF2_38_335]OFY77564.1 MAG: hypothetical protein A2281_01885 [Bacteroidetes bacterium RIFOXYA12_FULL_38_20]HBS87136.1 aminodeoxychorismate/anthranilate synthase component II [Bacteroidales bacterium]